MMSTTNQIFNNEMILLDKSYKDRDDFFDQIAEYLYSLGKVNKDFGNALRRREAEYPTGLMTEAYGVAIPHTDIEYVIAQCITFVRFEKPVIFSQMGDSETIVPAKFAFVLCIKEPEKQVDVLSTLVKIITDKELIGRLERTSTKQETMDMLNQVFEGIL